jgi:hypothetical protein
MTDQKKIFVLQHLTAGSEKNTSLPEFFGLKIFLGTLDSRVADFTSNAHEGR